MPLLVATRHTRASPPLLARSRSDPHRYVSQVGALVEAPALYPKLAVSSHLLSEIQAACDRLIMIQQGQLIFSGPLDELLAVQHATVVAITDDPAQGPQLADLVERAGKAVTFEDDTLEVKAAIATVIWGLFGALLAMVSRSAAISIAAGVGYFLIGEQLILQSLWPSTADWLPAGTLNTLASGGSSTVSFTTALALSALYGAAAYVATSLVFDRRDVTD